MNPSIHYQGGCLPGWKGPKRNGPRKHSTAAEIPDTHSLLGSVIFHFACFGAGTPYWDEYAIMRLQNKQALAARPFIAALPNRLLSLPGGGALAVIGHIDRGWSFSFQWSGIEEQNTASRGSLYSSCGQAGRLHGKPIAAIPRSHHAGLTPPGSNHTKNRPRAGCRTAANLPNTLTPDSFIWATRACIPRARGQPGEPRPALTVTSTASGACPSSSTRAFTR